MLNRSNTSRDNVKLISKEYIEGAWKKSFEEKN